MNRWEANIKMYLEEIGCEGVGWIHWAYDRVHWFADMNMVMNLQVP
jgi:hypothetical protein